MMIANETERRIAILQTTLVNRGIGALVAFANGTREGAGTVRYLTGWMPFNSEVFLVVPAKGRAVVVSADKNRARAFRMRFGAEGEVVKTTDLYGSLQEVLSRLVPAGTVVAYTGDADFTVKQSAEFFALLSEYDRLDGNAIVNVQRLERTPYEAGKHRKATEIADKLVAHAMGIASVKGITGAEIMAEVEYLGRRLGADSSSCWLAIGERPPETYFELFELVEPVGPHSRVQIGTTVCLDGYYSQVLRMGMFSEPSPELQSTSAAIIQMQDAALAKMVPGTPVHELVDVLEEMIDAHCPYTRTTDPFRFQSIHGMGNSYSEPGVAPFLNAGRDKSLDAGSPLVREHMVFEVHPNFTMPELGHVCHGDTAVVGKNGGAWLSKTPRGIYRLS
ncbi:M24 family metallopeptidase [Paenibacillus sp. FSL R10-2736]|uniref:M24 family metallopeptidase n=1 Tax=Paenibacillus sp. FSL R10-2736 TaxID=2954692 RepID=UPI0030FA6476